MTRPCCQLDFACNTPFLFLFFYVSNLIFFRCVPCFKRKLFDATDILESFLIFIEIKKPGQKLCTVVPMVIAYGEELWGGIVVFSPARSAKLCDERRAGPFLLSRIQGDDDDLTAQRARRYRGKEGREKKDGQRVNDGIWCGIK